MRKLIFALIALPTVAVAQPVAEASNAVKTFSNICLTGGVEAGARRTAVLAAGWKRDSIATIDVQKFAISKAIERNFDFSKPENSEQWSGIVDGKAAKIVLAKFPTKRRYVNICAIVIDGVKNAMPFGGELKSSFATFGIKGKSVDLVHYYEFAGKVGPNKHPVRGEIFTRSQASGSPDSMHIYVAY